MKRSLILVPLILLITGMLSLTFAQGCASPGDEEGVVVFGYFQPQYDYRFTDPRENTFRFNRMRLGVMGNIPYDFSYYALLEASPFVNNTGKIFLIDAFVTYSRSQYLKVSMGSFKKPFGQELSMPCSGLFTIERSKFVNELTGPDNRDFGLMVLGGSDTTFFEYKVALMNGTGPGLLDDNNFKDLYGRFIFRPFKSLGIGLNALYGQDPSTQEGAEEDKRMRLGVDLKYGIGPVKLYSEYIYAEDKGSYTTGGGCDGTPIEVHQGSVARNGFYLMGTYNINYKLQPVIKYEQYDNDPDTSGSNFQTITYGVNFYPNDWTRLQINYLYRAEDPIETRNDCLLVQVQVKF